MNLYSELKLDIICKEWKLKKSFIESINEFNLAFLMNELASPKTPDFYLERLKNLGFSGLEHVVDAGCGIGQWSSSLAKVNNFVTGIDPLKSRLDCAEIIAYSNNITNIHYCEGYTESIPLDSESVDGIWCYGVIMFTNISKTLKEFHRILKPNGKLYFNFNAFGWYLHLIIDRGLFNSEYKLARNGFKMVFNHFLKKDSQKLLRKKDVEQTLLSLGFKNILFDSEGGLAPALQYNNMRHSICYPKSYYGYPAVIEVLASK